MVQLHIADDVPQGGGGEVLDGQNRPLHAVGIELGVSHLVEDDGINLHGDIVFGNHRLGRKVHHLLLQGNFFGDAVDDRNLEVETCFPGGVVGAQALQHKDGGLGHDAHVGNQQRDNNDAEQDYKNLYHK